MIYTCTITPSIDYTVYLPEFHAGELNRSKEVYYYPGGKGINVSRVLKGLGESSIALGFAGGFTGKYITDFLEQEGIRTDFIHTPEITRINVKIKANEESELNGPGPVITPEQQEALLVKMKTFAEGDWFILAGSLPSSINRSFYLEIANVCKQNNVHFVLDTSGPALKNLIPAKPFLIKPNQQELGELFDTEVTSIADAVQLANQLVEEGVKHVIVSMGGEGAILATKDHAFIAKAPKGTVVNTVGSGDSLVSGFIASYINNGDPVQAFRYGVASGSATAFQADLCKKEDVMKLFTSVQIIPFQE
ncbi:1-phosphofructokinase [Virgibacillus dakarensis]|uniref:1-phosphofructokinase n=1 Tax=Virgibacillus dakarensis TaxID=1917889 RepID=UPI000B42F8D9|nr:1-phosphofructokinase [Virgibacillus dakarensis]MTW84578.1 1-phosphofructokinase [Virgibacillus dakarensis]